MQAIGLGPGWTYALGEAIETLRQAGAVFAFLHGSTVTGRAGPHVRPGCGGLVAQ